MERIAEEDNKRERKQQHCQCVDKTNPTYTRSRCNEDCHSRCAGVGLFTRSRITTSGLKLLLGLSEGLKSWRQYLRAGNQGHHTHRSPGGEERSEA